MNNGMKKMILALGVLASSYVMVGCSFETESKEELIENSKFEIVHEEWVTDMGSDFLFLKDKETGCEYIVLDAYRTQSMTPRLDAEGQPICGN